MSSNLYRDSLIKLKAVYTLVEQVYTGSQRALATVALSNEVPHTFGGCAKEAFCATPMDY